MREFVPAFFIPGQCVKILLNLRLPIDKRYFIS